MDFETQQIGRLAHALDQEGDPRIEKSLYPNPRILISRSGSISFEERQATLSFYVLNQDFFEKPGGIC